LNYFNYFSEIEETFIRRRGKNLFLSPLDWALIETWQEREVPLHIVLRGIEKVFDSYEAKPKKNRTIKSLMYCREEIEAQYEEWRESQIGKSETVEESDNEAMFSQQAITTHLENISNELKAAKLKTNRDLEEVIDRVVARLEELKTNYADAESLENDLTNLEKLLDENLLENSNKELFAKLQTETEKELQSYQKKMEPEVFQRTFDLILLKKLRFELGIPRLSLFYL
jgi:hypothetical protein